MREPLLADLATPTDNIINNFWHKCYNVYDKNANDSNNIKHKKLKSRDVSWNTPWAPLKGVRLCTWNGKSAFPAKWSRRCAKLQALGGVLDKHDVVCVQETHLSRRSVSSARKFALKHECVILVAFTLNCREGWSCLLNSNFY